VPSPPDAEASVRDPPTDRGCRAERTAQILRHVARRSSKSHGRTLARDRQSGRRHSGGGRAAIDNPPASEMLDTASRAPAHISPAFGNPLQPARGARPAAETASREAAPRSPAHTRIARAGVRPLHSPGSKCHGTSPHRAEAVRGAG
jgi:hypothetical protein